jgi:hypothetical protein
MNKVEEIMKKSMQFELWQECNSNCKFCYLGDENRCTPKILKEKVLDSTLERISDLSNYEEYDTLSFIGGEFFQGQLSDEVIKEKFFKIMDKVHELMLSGHVRALWMCATLTIGLQEDLYRFLDIFSDIQSEEPKDGVWICTSYDTIGRFHSDKMHDNWTGHMKNIHDKYPNIKFNTTIILTGDLVQKFLKDEFSFTEFSKEYNTTFFFKQPAPGHFGYSGNMESKQRMQKHLPNFFPCRKEFLAFMSKFSQTNPELFPKLFNIEFRADDLYRNFNNEEKLMVWNHRFKDQKQETNVAEDMELNKCGHLMQYASYIDSDHCMICDRNNILEE